RERLPGFRTCKHTLQLDAGLISGFYLTPAYDPPAILFVLKGAESPIVPQHFQLIRIGTRPRLPPHYSQVLRCATRLFAGPSPTTNPRLLGLFQVQAWNHGFLFR